MTKSKAVRVTISLPKPLLDLADRMARERSVSRSEVFADLLKKEESEELDSLMAEGYRELADQNRREVEETIHLSSEVVLRDG